MKIGKAIKKIRKELGFSQKDFADLCDISTTHLSQIENNKVNFNFSIIETISEITEIPIPVILFLSMEESDVKPDRIELYRVFTPTIDKFIKEVFFYD